VAGLRTPNALTYWRGYNLGAEFPMASL
jgi:hypothetical protein